MPTPENLLAFTLATILLILIPGPSMLFIVGRSISQGRRAGLLSVIGNALGQFPAIIAVSFGVGVIVASSVIAFTIIKIVGAVYLVWLGIQAIRTRKRNHGTPVLKRADAMTLLRQGFVVGVTNPKTIAFFVAILPQFVDHKAGPAWSQMLILGLVFFALAVIGDSIWAFAAGAARNWFGKSPKRMEGMSATGGVMMIGLGGVLAFSGSKS